MSKNLKDTGMSRPQINDNIICINAICIALSVTIPIGTFIFLTQLQTPVNMGCAILCTVLWHKLHMYVQKPKHNNTDIQLALHIKRWSLLSVTSMLVHSVLNSMIHDYSLGYIVVALLIICGGSAALSIEFSRE